MPPKNTRDYQERGQRERTRSHSELDLFRIPKRRKCMKGYSEIWTRGKGRWETSEAWSRQRSRPQGAWCLTPSKFRKASAIQFSCSTMGMAHLHWEAYSRGPWPTASWHWAYFQHLSQNSLNLSHYRRKSSPNCPEDAWQLCMPCPASRNLIASWIRTLNLPVR